MQFNSIATAMRHLTAFVIISLTALTGLLIAPASAAAETVYTFDGMTFTEAEKNKIAMADNQAKLGIAALYRGDWAKAQSHCTVALGSFEELKLPRTAKTVPIFSQVEACLADAYANLGDMKEACRLYRWTGYQTYRVQNPKAICDKYTAEAESKVVSADANRAINNEYAGVAGSFINRLAQLSAMPYGSARYAEAAELVPDCDKLRSYAASVPPALAAAGFCSGVVARERADARTSCKIMWTSAGQIRNAFASPLTPNIRAHAIDLKAMLDSFGQTCARDGYPWPEFSAAWPH